MRAAERVASQDVAPLLESVDELIGEVAGLDQGIAGNLNRRAPVDLQTAIARLHLQGALRSLGAAKVQLGLLHREAMRSPGRG